jgi:hypothetical protein
MISQVVSTFSRKPLEEVRALLRERGIVVSVATVWSSI